MTGRTWTALAVTALGVMLLGSSAAASGGAWPETAIVPLRLVTIQGGQLKVGIELRLGGGAPQLYTFDTGSAGFYAAYNPRWWPAFVPLGGTIQQSYGSGAMFEAEPVLTTVGIPTDVGEITAEVEVALITDAWGDRSAPPPRGRPGSRMWRRDGRRSMAASSATSGRA